jgi:hypothetical protein
MTLQEPSSGPGVQSEALVFLSFLLIYRTLGRPARSSIRFRSPPVVPAGSAGGRGKLRRNRTARREEDRTSSPVPAVQGLDPVARPRLPLVEERVRNRLKQLSARLGDGDWLDGALSAVSVLLRLKSSGILNEFPNLAAVSMARTPIAPRPHRTPMPGGFAT